MTDTQKTTVKGYVTTLDNTIADGDYLDLIVDIVSDRVLLYLNDTVVADSMLRVIAQVVVQAHKHSLGTDDKSIASVSDNGQTVSYHQTAKLQLASATDQELFTGFERLLAPYRRVHVIA